MRGRFAIVALVALAACGGEEPAQRSNKQAGPAARAAPKANPPVAAAPAQPHSSPWSPSGYALNGTEPFWGGSITGTTIRYMTPDDQFGDVIETRVTYAAGGETYAGAWSGRPFVLTLRRGPCSDGMSERSYAFSVELEARGESRRGCADPQ